MVETGNALVKRATDALDRLDRYAYEPASITDAFEFATWAAASGFYPSLKSPEQAVLVIAKGRELGLSCMAALDGIDIIAGRPAIRAAMSLAIVRASPRCKYVRLVEETAERATWETLRADAFADAPPARASFTLEEAQALGYLASKDGKGGRDQWHRQPATMLVWRAWSKLARREYSDVLYGIASTEELVDELEAERAKDTPATVEAAKPTSAASVVKGALAKAGIDVVQEARARTPPADPPPTPRTRGKLDKPKAEAPAAGAPPQRNEEASRLYQALVEAQAQLIERVGPDRAKVMWFSSHGPGKISHLTDSVQLATTLELAKALDRSLDVTAALNKVRAEWSAISGQEAVQIETPEAYSLESLERLLATDTAKLRALEAERDQALSERDRPQLEELVDGLQPVQPGAGREPGEEG